MNLACHQNQILIELSLYKSIELSTYFDVSQMSYKSFMYKNYMDFIAENELQVYFSHKFSKNEFFKLNDRQILPFYIAWFNFFDLAKAPVCLALVYLRLPAEC